MGVLNNIFVLTFIAVAATTQGSQLGGRCLYDRDCASVVEHTFCERQEMCSCMRGFKPDPSNEQCIANVGAVCTEDRDCISLQYSECRQGVCGCQRGYVPHPSENECLPEAAMFRSPCKERIQCTTALTDGATCYQDKCICLPEYHNFDNKCVINKGLNDACNSTGECYIDDTVAHMIECDEHKCVCKDDFVTVDNTCRDGGVRMVISLASLVFSFVLARIVA